MSCVAACGLRSRGSRRAPVVSRTASKEAHVRRSLRRTMAGLAVTLLVYSGLLAVSVREEEPFVKAGWTSSAAEGLRTYGTAAVAGGAAFVHEVAQTLTWILALAPLPLAVLSLLWLARRDQQAYLRLAIALLLSGTAGLAVLAVVRGWPVREASLFDDYLALPGASAGWYVLMVLVVFTTTTKTWPRVTVLLTALTATAAGTSTGGSPWLAALPAVTVPLLAWFAAGHLRRESRQPGPCRRGGVACAAGVRAGARRPRALGGHRGGRGALRVAGAGRSGGTAAGRMYLLRAPGHRGRTNRLPGSPAAAEGLEQGWGGRRAGTALSAMRLQPLWTGGRNNGLPCLSGCRPSPWCRSPKCLSAHRI